MGLIEKDNFHGFKADFVANFFSYKILKIAALKWSN